MIPKKGCYYRIRNLKFEDYSVIVKVVGIPVDSNPQGLIIVEFIRLPDSPLYCNWASYAQYGISIPIGQWEFKKAKKLTNEEVVAITL